MPLRGALFIAFTNMKVLSDDEVLTELKEPKTETLLELDLTEEPSVEEEKAGLFSGIMGKLKKNEDPFQPQEEPDFNKPPIIKGQTIASVSSIGLP